MSAATAVVTVSSSLAATALISGKHVVVAPNSPLSNLASTSLLPLHDPAPNLDRSQRAALLMMLSHRYSLSLGDALQPGGGFHGHLQALMVAANQLEWLLDLTDWSPDQLASLV